MDLVIKNVHVVNPRGVALEVDIGIENGLIASVGLLGDVSGIDMIDGTGLYAFPGFCDMHCHLRDPGFTHKEDLITGAYSAAAGGYTDICCMPNTKPPIDSVAIVTDVLNRSQKACIDIHPIASITKGMKGRRLTDFAKLHRAGAIAFSDDGLPVESIDTMTNAMRRSLIDDVLLMVHEENLALVGAGVVNAGANADRAGLIGIPPESEEEMVSRDLFLAERYGGRLHLCHVSTKGSVELIRRYKAKHLGNVTCETAPHYFSATDALIVSRNTNTKVNPPLRSEQDREAIIAGLIDGTIDAIATDHAPHARIEKDTDYEKAPFGVIGFETAFALTITNLFAPALLTLPQIIRLMSTNPRRILGLKGGVIARGQPADVALCDLSRRYTYEEDMIVSRSSNSPFIGMDLQGSVIMTVRKGKVVYDRSPYQ